MRLKGVITFSRPLSCCRLNALLDHSNKPVMQHHLPVLRPAVCSLYPSLYCCCLCSPDLGKATAGADKTCLDKIVYTPAASSKDDGDSMMLMQLLAVCIGPGACGTLWQCTRAFELVHGITCHSSCFPGSAPYTVLGPTACIDP